MEGQPVPLPAFPRDLLNAVLTMGVAARVAVVGLALLPAGCGALDAGRSVTTQLPHRGILANWILLGPFPSEPLAEPTADGVTRSGFDTDFLEALGGEGKAEIGLRTRVRVGEGPDAPTVAAVQAAPFASGHVAHRAFDLSVGYAFCHVAVDRGQEACLLFGSDGSPKVWVNGRLALRGWKDKHRTVPHEYAAPIRLVKGRNRVLVKLDNARKWWGYQMEIFTADDLRVTGAMERFLSRFPEAVKQLRARMDAAGRDLAFLDRRWRPVYAGMLAWLRRWMESAPAKPTGRDLSHWAYAAAVVETLESRLNFITLNPGCRVPVLFDATDGKGERHVGHYRVSFPRGYGVSADRFALLIRLHGLGDTKRGLSYTDSRRASRTDPAAGREVRPYVEVSPQRGSWWSPDYLNVLLDDCLERFQVDPDRVCATGGSMGGFGCWAWAMANPERLAAIAPCAALWNPMSAGRLKRMPIWVIHGEKDPIFPPWQAELMVSALRRCGGAVRYTCEAKAAHGGWERHAQSEEFDHWILASRRSEAGHPPNPIDALGLVDGVGPVRIATIDARHVLRSTFRPPTGAARDTHKAFMAAARQLYDRYRAGGHLADTCIELSTGTTREADSTPTYELVLPLGEGADPARIQGQIDKAPRMKVASFYYDGPEGELAAAVERVQGTLLRDGHQVTGERWDAIVSPGFGEGETFREVRLVLR